MTTVETATATGRASSARHRALDIATALEMPPPTAEQAAVIEAGARPLLVVAGAGSGKTETMAARVVWLVANGLVDPDQVLGLTFTRKAAAELSQRIAKRLRGLERAGIWTPPADDGTGAEVLGGTPTVSTYHAYAGRLVREHALRVGIEPEFRILTEAGAWQLAAEAVSRWDGPMDDVVKSEATVIQAVMALAGEMAEHVRTPGEVMAHLDEVLARLDALPDGDGRGSLTAARDAVTVLRERRTVLPIVEAFLDLKRERESLDFADQMAIAARLTKAVPAVGEIERERFRAVLLDEFQDTSEAQLELLRSLFHHPGVALTAVGDPNQSIYGWRGASATTLLRFPTEFASDEGPADVLPLSTSWRNDALILEAANTVAAPLATEHVQPLRPRPGAGVGTIEVARLETAEEEADHLAGWIASHWFSPSGRRTGRSAAVLCRRRSTFPLVLEALRRRQLPVEVVGLGGLLVTPEVSDLVSALWVVQDPTRGDQLMRLLTGPVVRLGAADLAGLWAWARELHGRTPHPGTSTTAPAAPEPGATQPGVPASVDETPGGVAATPAEEGSDGATADDRRGSDLAADSADTATLVEALDDLPRPGWTARDGARISDEALTRLHDLGEVVRRLRRLTALPLVDLVAEAEVAIGLDIEVLSRPEHTASTARVHLDAFADVAARYATTSDRPTLSGFLSWLDAARDQERGLDAGHTESDADAVQVLTVHAAKGLEWDVVAVPTLVEGVFPAHGATAVAPVTDSDPTAYACSGDVKDKGWLVGLDSLPYDLRGDRAGLPHLDWRGVPDRKALSAAIDTFVLDGGRHAVAEERRLAYVALTRARSSMLLTTHLWGAAKKTLSVPSRFLTEVEDSLPGSVTRTVWVAAPEPVVDDKGKAVAPTNPHLAVPLSQLWPHDPMGTRRQALLDAHRRIASLVEVGPHVPHGDPRVDDLRILLAEQAARRSRGEPVVAVPRHLSASAVVSLARDAEAFAMSLRRPMPSPPAVAARQGTAFHAWIEEHYSRAAFVDLLDLPGSADEGAADDSDLDAMKERFLASEWADRIPEEIEMSIETIIDGIAVRGRVDAVFPRDDGGWTVVDWKTGARPTGRDATVRALQLGAYAVAFARLRGVDPTLVDAAFYYAGEGVTVRPDLPGEAALGDLLRTLPE
ncbi:ATP-dependent DNA helicase [Terrabacter aerolatus]|uniref:DNA 3'-5' helicase n=1 Tax=Terrabacter aerolatus TaxID=422442 RepID=A0A512D1R2_9MICO|nr:UvrD-helicase domain-containing protein [Terrabacter aerolatus]GEO30402.1 ATP-dependent DNA helicase [Terrabacter aerolatus]